MFGISGGSGVKRGNILCNQSGESEDISFDGASGGLSQMEESLSEILLVLLRSDLSLQRDRRRKRKTLGMARLRYTVFQVLILRTDVIPCGMPYVAPSLCPKPWDKPSGL